jgi:hypothetical protein
MLGNRGQAASTEGTVGMTTDTHRFGQATIVLGGPAPRPPLDYYLILAEDGTPAGQAGQAEAILVEEFVLADDCTAVGLNSTGWTPAGRGWWNSTAFSRGMRADPGLRARVVPVSRHGAQTAYRQLGGGELPTEPALRSYFPDSVPLTSSTPLRLDATDIPAGYHDKRIYRILFANDLTPQRVAQLWDAWRMTTASGPADPDGRVIGTATLSVGDDLFSWDLRQVGRGIAWCLDVTVCLGGGPGNAIEPVLRQLTAVMRRHGLLPMTIERFR